MKRNFTFMIAAIVLLTFLAVPMGMWGQTTDTYSLTPDQSSTGSSATSYITSLTEFTYSGVTWKMNQWNPSTLQIKTNQSSAASEFRFYNNSAFGGRITKVVLKFSALTLSNMNNTGFMFVGGTSAITATTGGTAGVWNSDEKTITWTPSASDNYTYFAFYQNGKVATGTNKLATADAIVVTYETGGGTDPTITVASSLTVSPKAVTNAELAVTYSNLGTLTSGTVTLYDSNDQVINPAWFSAAFNNDYSKVIYTTTNNTSGAENSLRMHLAVSDGTNNATADVAVTQDFILTTMDQIFARATANGSTAKEVTIDFNDWVITGHNGGSSYSTAQKAWLTDGTKGCAVFGNTSATYPQFQANDKLNGIITCNLQLYTSFAEITGVKKGMTGLSTTSDGEVTPVTNQTITGLNAINTGSVVTLTNLTYSSSTQLLSDENSNTIKPVSQIYSSMSFTDGKTYNVTGVFETSSSNPTKRIYPRNGADIVEVVPTTPTVYVNPTTLSSFTYVEGNGPSTTQSLTVSGINLTESIGIALTNGNAFELSTDQSTWSSSLTLTQTNGTVNETPVYVRMKAGLSILAYNDVITFSSTGATSVTVNPTGTVTQPCVTWNLATNSYVSNPAPTEDLIQWTSNYVTMKNEKGTGTKVNNYIPPTQNSTRFYNGNDLTITPATGYAITSVVFTATTSGYANALANSTWTNSTASAYTTSTPYTVTVTPTDGAKDIEASIGGTCGFTEVKVYYETVAVAPTWSTLPTPTINAGSNYMLDLSDYVTGSPTPTITLTSTTATNGYVFEADVLDFTPTANGTYTFTFTATNTADSANATLTITVTTIYTILYSVNGADGGEASVVAGNAIGTLPVPTENIPTGFTFVGWMESPAHPYYNATTAPTMVTSATIPSGDMMLDAVFCSGTSTTTWTKSSSAPANDEQVIVATLDGSKYYAMNGPEGIEFTVSNNTITGTVPAAVFTAEISMEGSYLKNDNGYLHFNSKALKVASGTTNGDITYATLNDGFSLTANDRVMTYDNENHNFGVSATTSDAATMYVFKSTTTTTANDYTTSVISHADQTFIAENDNETLYGIHYINGYVLAGNNVTNGGKLVINNGGILDISILGVGFTNATAANLIIEDGGQLITTSFNVAATVKKNITSRNNGGGWNFIASPIKGTTGISPAVAGLVTDDLGSNANTETASYDLYKFVENPYGDGDNGKEWKNYRNNSFNLMRGTGYLYANVNDVTLTFTGTLDPSPSVGLTYTAGVEFAGWNLVGNPLPCNAYLSGGFYAIDGPNQPVTARPNTTPIAPCTGAMVQASGPDQSVSFSKTVPSSAKNGNLQMTVAQQVVTRGEAQSQLQDNAIVSFNENSQLEKFIFDVNNAKLYIPQNGKDYAIVSAQANGEMPVSFKATENGTYTITVSPENVEMNYLHLIDNMTGMDIDLLQTPSYTFEASTRDYESRFRLVFNANNANGTANAETFAYYNGNEWVIANDGTATLQVVDMMGRIVSTQTVNGNTALSTNGMSTGVYVMRLVNGNDVKTQKIVVR